jgi:tetratricopeptide (TPR) repeat protein
VVFLVAALLAPTLAAAARSDGLPRADGWIVCRTPHFTFYSNASAAKTRKVAVQLERFRQALGRITRGFELDARVPTSTFVFKNDTVYEPYRRNRDGRPLNVSGYFLPRPFHNYITLDLSAGASPMRTVYHEYFHAVMDTSMGSLPIWLNEGLAEYFSTFKSRETAVVEVGHPIEEHLVHVANHGLISWKEIFETTTHSKTYNEGDRQGSFYAQSWLLVHYLNSTDEGLRALGKYLSALRSGTADAEAFAEAFGEDRAAMGARAAAYLKSGSNYVSWDFGDEHGEVDVRVEELEPAEVYYRLGDLLAQGGPAEDAETHLDAAEAAGWPVWAVETSRGVARFYGDDDLGAERSFSAAVDAGAKSVEPYVMLSWLLYDRFVDSPRAHGYRADPPPEIVEVRNLALAALRLVPDDFHALTTLARTHLFDGGDPVPGIAALDRARAQRPLDLELLQIRAALLGHAGDVEGAWAVVEQEMMPRDPDLALETVDYVVNGLTFHAVKRSEAGDREGAVALLDEATAILGPPWAGELVRMREALASGGAVVFSETADEAAATAEAADDYNAAVQLASAGRHEEALERMERLVESCGTEQICALARSSATELRELVEHNRFVARFNSAVDKANAGDHRGAAKILRELEQELDDPQQVEQVRELLRALEAAIGGNP